ncbi:DUF7302 family protein [Agromyces larvae]|uniref:Uncharacterized protein n=1 Tax=Agromyces larvae TaxID=2929802 RepID=A0ABY4C5X2_9MICO|nr:hypothetical protein [Agromyces larvae]UOE45476.1 hypothetical protein MTO99_06885 [Agromyces larvae]
MALTLTHEKSGRQVTVPDDAADAYLANGWSIAGKPPAKAAPKSATRKRAPSTKKAAETEVSDGVPVRRAGGA